jgi:hypothetical protein
MADVQKNAFMLSSATVMMAPAFTTDVFSLRPDLHSLGISEDVQVGVDSSLIELKAGVAQATIDAKRTNVSSSISASLREFSAANVLRSLALASTPVVMKRGKLSAALASGAVTMSIVTDPVPGEATSDIASNADIPAGATILIQRANGTDYVFPTKSSGAATGTGPYTIPIAAPYAIPAGMTFAAGDSVWIINDAPIASMDADDLFGVKITGTLSNYNRPVTAIFPKVRVSKGFQISFSEKDYGSMPMELAPLLLASSEATGRLAEIGTRAPGRIYLGS